MMPGPRIARTPVARWLRGGPAKELSAADRSNLGFFRHEPSHEAWLLCNIRKQRDFSPLGSALSLTEKELFAVSIH
jgi:hypothetical protein